MEEQSFIIRGQSNFVEISSYLYANLYYVSL